MECFEQVLHHLRNRFARISDYAQVGAYRFPRHGEIAWDLPNGEFIYWRGDVLTLEPADL